MATGSRNSLATDSRTSLYTGSRNSLATGSRLGTVHGWGGAGPGWVLVHDWVLVLAGYSTLASQAGYSALARPGLYPARHGTHLCTTTPGYSAPAVLVRTSRMAGSGSARRRAETSHQAHDVKMEILTEHPGQKLCNSHKNGRP